MKSRSYSFIRTAKNETVCFHVNRNGSRAGALPSANRYDRCQATVMLQNKQSEPGLAESKFTFLFYYSCKHFR